MRLAILILTVVLAGCASSPGDSPATDVVDLTDAEVVAVVAAMRETERVSDYWRPRLENAASEDEHEALSERYRRALVRAVEEQGFTLEEYRQIARAAREDPELARRIEQAMEATDR